MAEEAGGSGVLTGDRDVMVMPGTVRRVPEVAKVSGMARSCGNAGVCGLGI